MSRTPLFSLVRKSLRLADAANRSDAPFDELIERANESRLITRRSFVQGSAATLSLAAVGACAPSRTRGGGLTAAERSSASVLVVGAGIAGLSAAYRLQQAGMRVKVIEAQNRIGGRMFSLRDRFADGQVCELGGELIDTGHTHMQAMAKELGIPLDDLSTDDPSLNRSTWFIGGQRRSETEVVRAFQPLAVRIRETLRPFGKEFDPTWKDPRGSEALDRMTIAQWFDKEGVSGWLRTLLTVAYTTEYGMEIDRQSALNFLMLIGNETQPFEVFGASDERYHVQGGNDRIVQELARRVNAFVETGTMLEALEQRADGSFVASIAKNGSSSTLSATHVVIAIPFTVLRNVKLTVNLPPVKQRAISELGYGTNAKLMVGFSSRPWRTLHKNNGSISTDLPFQLTWETSRLQPGRAGLLTNFTGGNHGIELGRGTEEEQATALVDQLEQIVPGIAATRAGMTQARFHWPTNPWVRGSYAGYLPGQWTGIRGEEGSNVGRLYFAGEHCSLAAQGFMEGGCETGQQATSNILA
ncbi:MAG: NAD(P)/FAD-dependent oxidoreductase [Gemmatimonadaceae bacterium]